MLYSQQVQTKKKNTKDRETETDAERERDRQMSHIGNEYRLCHRTRCAERRKHQSLRRKRTHRAMH